MEALYTVLEIIKIFACIYTPFLLLYWVFAIWDERNPVRESLATVSSKVPKKQWRLGRIISITIVGDDEDPKQDKT